MNYKRPIFLDFNHAYTEEIKPDYFLSYDKGRIKYKWQNYKGDQIWAHTGIVVRQVSHEFDVEATLKLLEYSILNNSQIRRNQQEIVYEQNYCQWKIQTLDTLIIQKVLAQPTSDLVEEIMAERTYLNSDKWNFGVDYYYQNKQFHFLVKANNGVRDTIAISTNNLFQVEIIDSGTKLVFDSDSTFYCIGWQLDNRVISKKHTVKEVKDNYEPFHINNIGNDLVSITMRRFVTLDEEKQGNKDFYFEKTSVYDIETDIFIDDLKKGIKK